MCFIPPIPFDMAAKLVTAISSLQEACQKTLKALILLSNMYFIAFFIFSVYVHESTHAEVIRSTPAGTHACAAAVMTSDIKKTKFSFIHHDEIFNQIKNRGLRWQDIRIVLRHDDVVVIHKGKYSGGATLESIENQNRTGYINIGNENSSMIYLNEDFRGIGLGFILHLTMAKAAYLQGLILESGDDSLEETQMWEMLYKKGFAVKEPMGVYSFNPQVLRNVDFQRELDAFLALFSLRAGEVLHTTNDLL